LEENKLNNSDEFLKLINFETSKCNKDDKKDKKIMMYSPAQLAYAGDAVYELLARSYVIHKYNANVNKMHRITVKFVKANTQAYLISKLEPNLTEEEKKIVKRGRNAKVTSSPKNAELTEYRYATGFEALFGYLYLGGNIDRLMCLFKMAIEIIGEKDRNNEDN
jgi:ribonuclease-3 family protein